jgi:EmrB/QacA subfamily drug resistance transporter
MINPQPRPCESAIIGTIPAAPDRAKATQRWVLAATVLGSTMAYVDESVVTVALPTIERDLDTSLAAMQWVVNAYTLCMSALLLIGGAAGDRFGRRLIFALGTVIFAVGSLGCGLAPGIVTLILGRAVQGVGAALLIPCSLAIIGAAFAESERGEAIGIWSGASSVAAGLGPLLGGWLVDHTSSRVIFLINPVLAIPTVWIALRCLPESRDPDAPSSLDWLGAALAFGGLFCLAYGLIAASDLGWWDVEVLLALASGALLLAVFVWHERRSPAPMMPLDLFRSRRFSGVNLLTLLLYGALGGAFFFLPFLLIQVHGYSATAVGAAFLPFTLVLGALSRWSGGLLDRFGARWPLTVGPAISAIGLALLAWPGAGGSYWTSFFPPMIVLGFGMAITVAPLTTAVINAVPERQTATASGINNAVASVASLLVIALLGTIATAELDRTLDRQLAAVKASPEIAQAVDGVRGGLVVPPLPATLPAEASETAHAVIAASFTEVLRRVMLIAAALAFAGALAAALTIGPDDGRTERVGPDAR